jgi:hypothetical protein
VRRPYWLTKRWNALEVLAPASNCDVTPFILQMSTRPCIDRSVIRWVFRDSSVSHVARTSLSLDHPRSRQLLPDQATNDRTHSAVCKNGHWAKQSGYFGGVTSDALTLMQIISRGWFYICRCCNLLNQLAISSNATPDSARSYRCNDLHLAFIRPITCPGDTMAFKNRRKFAGFRDKLKNLNSIGCQV